jgi:hypothetical protein
MITKKESKNNVVEFQFTNELEIKPLPKRPIRNKRKNKENLPQMLLFDNR